MANEYNPHGRRFLRCKEFGVEVCSNLDYLKRRGIVFQWGRKLFDGNVFGTEIGPSHCLLSGGFHDLAHAIDFVMMGRAANVHRYGMAFNRPWQNKQYIPGIGYIDDEPKTSQITRSELRTFALQAWLIEREAGALYDMMDSCEEDEARAAGYLSEFPARGVGEDFSYFWKKDNSLLHTLTIEEYAADKATLLESPGFPDEFIFTKEVMGISWRKFWNRDRKEAKLRMKQGFSDMLIDRYEQIRTNPFLQNRIDKALNQVAARIRKQHKDNDFVFNSAIHYGTPA